MEKRRNDKKKNILAECAEVASKLFYLTSVSVGKRPPEDQHFSQEERSDFFETVSDIANDLAAFEGADKTDNKTRRAFLRCGHVAVYAVEAYLRRITCGAERVQWMSDSLRAHRGKTKYRYDELPRENLLSSLADELSDYYYSLFSSADEPDKMEIAKERMETRLRNEGNYRFPDMAARENRAKELEKFPIFDSLPNIQNVALLLENPNKKMGDIVEDYAAAIVETASLLAEGNFVGADIDDDPEIIAVAHEIDDSFGDTSAGAILGKILPSVKDDLFVAASARESGMRLLDAIKGLGNVTPTGDERYNYLRSATADVAFMVVRELLQFDEKIEKNVNFLYLDSIAENMRIVIGAMTGEYSLGKSKKNLRKFYFNFVESFKDEVAGAKERCNAITQPPIQDEFDILARIVDLTEAKMKAYNHMYETADASSYCANCYAGKLVFELDEEFGEKYASRLRLIASGMEKLANTLHLPDGRGDVFVQCAFGFRQYMETDEPDAIYDEILMRFSCALVELAGLIYCGVIDARTAAQTAWLDESFLEDLSRRDGIKEYCVAMGRATA